MNNLIPLNAAQLAGEAVQTINARDLHAFLEVETRFDDWMRRRIEEYGFVKNLDYVCSSKLRSKHRADFRSNLSGSAKNRMVGAPVLGSSQTDSGFSSNLRKTSSNEYESGTFSPFSGKTTNGVVFSETKKNSKGGRPAIDYHLSLDMAKELAMVEKTEKGREARRYFIDCERRAKAAAGARTRPLRSGRASAASRLVDAFLTECTTPDPDGLVPAGETYAAFLSWCQGKAVSRVPSSIAFGRRLKARGIQQEFDKRYYRWLGIALVPALPGRTAAIPPVAGFDATFARRISLLSADFYDSFRDAILRCDALYREHRMLLRDRFPRTVRDHDVDALLRQAEASGLSMIETASEALCAANHQMRSTERIYRLAIECGK